MSGQIAGDLSAFNAALQGVVSDMSVTIAQLEAVSRAADKAATSLRLARAAAVDLAQDMERRKA